MPMYDFSCKTCGKDFEELVPRDRLTAACPSCKGTDTTRKMSVFSSRTGNNSYTPPPSSGGCAPSG